jgi:hypothetical protein
LAALECVRTFLAGAPAWHISPDYPTSLEMIRILTKLVENIPSIDINKNDRIFTAPAVTDGYIQIRGASTKLRGVGLGLVIFDEVIDIPDFTEIWQGKILPTLATSHGRALFISSVFAFDHFWELVLKAQSNRSPDWRAWVLDAYHAGVIPRTEIELQKSEMTENRFAREYMCQPMQLGSVFALDSDNKSALRVSTAVENHTYLLSVDVGGSVDNSVVAVLDVSVDPVELVFMDAFLEPSFSAQIVRIGDIWLRFGSPSVIVESNNAGTSLIQAMRDAGIPNVRPLTTTNASKADQVERLKLAFENHRLRVIDDPALLLELAAFESSKTPSGMIHYGASKGHDDRVMALLLAYAGTVEAPKSRVSFLPNPLFRLGNPVRESPFSFSDRAEWEESVAKSKSLRAETS